MRGGAAQGHESYEALQEFGEAILKARDVSADSDEAEYIGLVCLPDRYGELKLLSVKAKQNAENEQIAALQPVPKECQRLKREPQADLSDIQPA